MRYLTLASFVLGSLVALWSAILTSTASAANGETLTVLFTDGRTGTQTERAYSGSVTITVTGFGQSAGTQYSDAFYIFTDSFGNHVTPQHLPEFGLWINDQPVENWLLGVPHYRSDHTYQFTIQANGDRLRFRFAIGDLFTVDNSGSFTIRIAQGGSKPAPSTANVVAPFNNSVSFSVVSGYYNNRAMDQAGCHVGIGPDHCRHQLFALDLAPHSQFSSDRDVLAPVSGRITWVEGDCLGIGFGQPPNQIDLTICHLSQYVKRGQKVEQGALLGMRTENWVHLSMRAENGACSIRECLPIAFSGPYTFEGISLAPGGPSQESVNFAGQHFTIEFQQYLGWSFTSSNVRR